MSTSENSSFKDKHPQDAVADKTIALEIKNHLHDGKIPCAVAFDIAGRLKASPAKIGQTIDLMDIHLCKCQLGLFGYQPEAKKVIAEKKNLAVVQSLIEDALEDGALPCASAWRIAKDQKLTKMAISNACEALKLKIKPCQLGAF